MSSRLLESTVYESSKMMSTCWTKTAVDQDISTVTSQ
jgi:hypothetical protein